MISIQRFLTGRLDGPVTDLGYFRSQSDDDDDDGDDDDDDDDDDDGLII